MAYSTFGYVLLSAAREALTGKSFFQLLDDEVLQPLAMTATTADFPEAIIPGRVRPYSLVNKVIQNSGFVDNSNKWAAGGYLSTAEDLTRLGRSLLEPGFLSAAAIKLALTPSRTADGAGAFLYVEPQAQIVVAIVANLSSRIDENDARAIARATRN